MNIPERIPSIYLLLMMVLPLVAVGIYAIIEAKKQNQ
jgi:hypothetical protein